MTAEPESPIKAAQYFKLDQFVPNQPETLIQPSEQNTGDIQVAATADAALNSDLSASKNWHGWGIAVLTILFFATVQWGLFLQESWQQSLLQGVAASALTAVAVLLGSRTLYQSWRARRQLRQVNRLQAEGEQILQALQFGQAQPWLDQAQQQVKHSPELRAFRAQPQSHLSDAERVKLFDLLVLQQLDQQASLLTRQAALQTSVAVAISPFALADLLLVTWRSFRLMAEIGQLYGVRISIWQRGHLLKAFLQALFWTGSSELVLDLGSDLLGAELSTKLSARAGQGVLAGLMVGRIGAYCQRQYRPLPLPLKNMPVQTLLSELVAKLRQKSS